MHVVTTEQLSSRRGIGFFGTNISDISLDIVNRKGQTVIDKSWTVIIVIGLFFAVFISFPAIIALFDSKTGWGKVFELALLPIGSIAISTLLYLPTSRLKIILDLNNEGVALKQCSFLGSKKRFIPWPEFIGVHMRLHQEHDLKKDSDNSSAARNRVRSYQVVELIHPDLPFWLPVYIKEGRAALPEDIWKATAKALDLPAYFADGDHLVIHNKKTPDLNIAEQVKAGMLEDNFNTTEKLPPGIKVSLVTAYGESAIRIDIKKPTPRYVSLGLGLLSGLAATSLGFFFALKTGDWAPLMVLGFFGLGIALISGLHLADQLAAQYLIITPERVRRRHGKSHPITIEEAKAEKPRGPASRLSRDGLLINKILEVHLVSETRNAVIKLVTSRATIKIGTALSGKEARWLRDYLKAIFARSTGE